MENSKRVNSKRVNSKKIRYRRRDSKTLKGIAGIITIMVMLLGIFLLRHDQPMVPITTESNIILALIDKRYLRSDGTLVVSLENRGESLDFVTKEDFKVYLDDLFMGTVSSLCFVEGRKGKWDKGEIIKVTLKVGEDIYGKKVKLIFRGTPIEFSV